MIFVDTNVILDLLENDATPEAAWSRAAMAELSASEPLVANLIVAAELSAQVRSPERLAATLARADIDLVDLDLATAHRAGTAHREYRRRGGARRTILPDFLIASHAETMGAALLTRDRGLASYFPDLTLITPETQP